MPEAEHSRASSRLFADPNFYSVVFLVAATLIAIGSVFDYGISWDEYFRWQGGEQKYAYYSALLAGDWEAASEFRAVGDKYPGLFDLSLAVLRRVSPFGAVETGHLWSVVFGLMGIGGAMALGRALGGPWTGLATGILLVAFPRYRGHMFINPKDIPFAAMFVWAMWGLVRVLGGEQRLTWRSALLFGALAGCAMAVRIGGLLMFCYGALFLGLETLWRWRAAGWAPSSLIGSTMRLVGWLFTAAVPALLILILFWPNAHRNPFAATANTLSEVTSFGWEGKVLYRGELLRAVDIPWHYLPTWIAIATPLVWYYIAMVGLILLGIQWKRSSKWTEAEQRTGVRALAVAFGALFPVLYYRKRCDVL